MAKGPRPTVCKGCGVALTPETQWIRQGRWRAECRKCEHAKQVAWVAANRGRIRVASRKRLSALRWEVLTQLSGSTPFCACCGTTYEPALTIDHRHGSGRQHRKALGDSSSNMYQFIKRQGFPKEWFGVLCYNCNNVKAKLGACGCHRSVPLAQVG